MSRGRWTAVVAGFVVAAVCLVAMNASRRVLARAALATSFVSCLDDALQQEFPDLTRARRAYQDWTTSRLGGPPDSVAQGFRSLELLLTRATEEASGGNLASARTLAQDARDTVGRDLVESVLRECGSQVAVSRAATVQAVAGQLLAVDLLALGLLVLSSRGRPEPQPGRHRALVEAAEPPGLVRSRQDLVLVVTPQGLIEDVNEILCLRLGYAVWELQGRELEFVLSDSAASGLGAASGSYLRLETSLRCRDGRRIPVLIHCTARRDDQGRLSSLVLTAHDLSDHDLLRKAEQQLEALLHSPELAMVRLSRKGDCLQASAGVGELLGQAPIKPWEEYLAPEHRVPWRGLLDELFAGQRNSFQMEVALLGRTRRWGNIMVNLEPGTPAVAVCLIHDITARRETEVALARAQEDSRRLLEQLLHAQEQERRAVARDVHDGFLQSVIAAELHVEAHLRNRNPDEKNLGHCLERLHDAVVEGRRLIQNLRPANLEQFGLGPAIRQLLDDSAEPAGWSVSFQDNTDRSLPAAVETAAYRIVQEALSNALKHAETSRVEVCLEQSEVDLKLSVRDFGKGLPEQSNRGSGMGLKSMRERAELLGGTLVVATLEPGTLIRAAFPIRSR